MGQRGTIFIIDYVLVVDQVQSDSMICQLQFVE